MSPRAAKKPRIRATETQMREEPIAVLSSSAAAEDETIPDAVPWSAVENPPPSDIQTLLLVNLWSNNSEVVEKALEELGTLCYHNDQPRLENRKEIHRLGGRVCIVGAMKKWQDVPSIQSEGCRALMHVVCRAFVNAATNTGTVEAVAWALQNYPADRHVQAHGCGALSFLCDGSEQNAICVTMMLGAVDSIVAAMKYFPNAVAVQRTGSNVLWNLSKFETCRHAIVAAGGRRALVDAMDHHWGGPNNTDVTDLQRYARYALQNLIQL
jgi:hypothetical protein